MTLSHFGISTSDLERSIRFYVEALGFEHLRTVDVPPVHEPTMDATDLKCRAAFLMRDGAKIELIGFENPAPFGARERRPMHQLGFTHMAFTVEDFEACAERIERLGGRLHRETRSESPMGTFVFCTDPDGVRIELWETGLSLETAGG
jgi:lactoylglutathione lyase